jgi:TolB-like protein
VSTPPPIEIVSHYRLLELLGRGAMGEVWLADDLQLPRRVAVKLLPRHLSEDAEAVERLLREARAAATVDHPNVVTVHDAGVIDGHAYLVMQRVEGETLERRLTRGVLPAAEAIAVTSAIADALAEVHALGIVHRDLKPSNIMLTARGPKVLDFGLAAVGGHGRMTVAGTVVGTPLYMSPEQVQGRAPDNRSDLWALGAILYEALTGARPFAGDSLAATAHAVLHEQPAPPSQRNAAVSPRLDSVVEKLLRKDPALRYARAEDLIADLKSCAAAQAGSGAAAVAAAGSTVAMEAAGAIPRLAVLYFEVLSADPDDAFLATGLTEDLIVDLARVEGLRVAARGEVQPFRGRELPPRTVARELNVDYVVQGSVRRAGQRARISAQLVRASDGHATWAERFDRTIEDLFDVQAEVSKRIVEALQVTLRPAERELLDRAPTRDREAYGLYLRARELMDTSRRSANFEAELLLRQALARDPDFALAHATLAECYGVRGTAWWAGREMVDQVRPHARRALELDPSLPEAHIAAGYLYRLEGNAQALLAELDATKGLESTSPLVARWAGWGYLRQGKPELALPIIERAHRLFPRDYRIVSALCDCYLTLGRKADEQRALGVIRDLLVQALDRDPGNTDARALLSIALAQSGNAEAGIAQAERAIADEPDDGRVRYNAACAFTYAGPSRACDRAAADDDDAGSPVPHRLGEARPGFRAAARTSGVRPHVRQGLSVTLDTGAPSRERGLHPVLFGPHGLRAGWRLLLFLAIVVPLEALLGFVRRHLLHGVDRSASFMVRELADFLIFVFASSMMGRLEHKTLADYGLPWRQRFRARFWQGAAIGFGTITALVLAMRACGVARFGGVALHGFAIVSWAALYAFGMILVALREEFRARGYGFVTLASGIGFWPAAACPPRTSAGPTTAMPASHPWGSSTSACTGSSRASCCATRAICGCRSASTLRSTGARATSTVSRTAATHRSAICSARHRPVPRAVRWHRRARGSVLCTVVLLLVGAASAWLIRPATEPTPPLGFPPAA